MVSTCSLGRAQPARAGALVAMFDTPCERLRQPLRRLRIRSTERTRNGLPQLESDQRLSLAHGCGDLIHHRHRNAILNLTREACEWRACQDQSASSSRIARFASSTRSSSFSSCTCAISPNASPEHVQRRRSAEQVHASRCIPGSRGIRDRRRCKPQAMGGFDRHTVF